MVADHGSHCAGTHSIGQLHSMMRSHTVPARPNTTTPPKKYTAVGCTIGVQHDKSAPNNDYYNHADLRVSGYLNVYGLQEVDLVEVAEEKEVSKVEKRAVPPYNGFGTEEDSLGS